MNTYSEPLAIWLTGLPASGKSTLANLLSQELESYGLVIQVLDSDEIRKVLTPDPTYTDQERNWLYEVLTYIGKLLTQNGINVIFAATAHRRHYRDRARDIFGDFFEVYIECPLQTCMQRDQKGIYRKAVIGDAQTVPGIQELYETSEMPEIVVNTERNSPGECIKIILRKIKNYGYLGVGC